MRVSSRPSTNFRGGAKKYVAYNRETKLYINLSCDGYTKDRNWAWVGNVFQRNWMIEHCPLFRDGMKIYRDREELFHG